MANCKVKQLYDTVTNENVATERKTGWFPITELSKTSFIRSINTRYASGDDITVTMYIDGDIDTPAFTGTLRANDGTPSQIVTTAMNNSTTSITCTSHAGKFKKHDFIKIEDEIMRITADPTNTALTVERAMRGTTAAGHGTGEKIYFANFKDDTMKVGKRAKYAMVKLSSAESKNSIEINRMEIEH
jgi:hypothetical protein